MPNDLILSLETATRGGSLALMHGGSLLASSTGIADESHSISLLSRIESLLKDASISLRDIDCFATASGPGSFTGLRIGLATMKAFAAVFNRPCIGIPTLEAIAFAAGSGAECIYALLPAGRGEVFSQLFSGAPSVAEHIPPNVLLERVAVERRICWAGPGAHLYKDLIQERAVELGITFAEFGIATRWTLAPNVEQLAKYVAILALTQLNNGTEYRPEDLRAIYVRPSDAELNK